MNTISAIFENGVFRPVDPVELTEGTRVQIVVPESRDSENIEPEPTAAQIEARRRVYEILSRRFDSGHRDTAERHNEHQP